MGFDNTEEKDLRRRLTTTVDLPGSITVFRVIGQALDEAATMAQQVASQIDRCIKGQQVGRLACDFIKGFSLSSLLSLTHEQSECLKKHMK